MFVFSSISYHYGHLVHALSGFSYNWIFCHNGHSDIWFFYEQYGYGVIMLFGYWKFVHNFGNEMVSHPDVSLKSKQKVHVRKWF